MKAISLWQPWATLIALGEKRIETRSWRPSSPVGEIAIHAAKRWSGDLLQMCLTSEPFRSVLDKHSVIRPTTEREKRSPIVIVPLGAIVAVAHLVRVVPTSSVFERTGRLRSWPFGRHERDLGDYSDGRYAWILQDVRPLSVPVPCVGRQRLFDVGPTVAREVRRYASRSIPLWPSKAQRTLRPVL